MGNFLLTGQVVREGRAVCNRLQWQSAVVEGGRHGLGQGEFVLVWLDTT